MSFLGNCCSKVTLNWRLTTPWVNLTGQWYSSCDGTASPSRDTNTISLLLCHCSPSSPSGPWAEDFSLDQFSYKPTDAMHLCLIYSQEIPAFNNFQIKEFNPMLVQPGLYMRKWEREQHIMSALIPWELHFTQHKLGISWSRQQSGLTSVQLTEIFLLKRMVFTEDPLRTDFVKQKRAR